MGSIMRSKEDEILELFFNYPSRYWHFKDIKRETGMADSKISNWLKKLQKEKIIIKHSPKGKMPYYTGNHESSEYRNTKRIYGMQMLHKAGVLNYLLSLDAEIVIIFGSFTRSDWHKDSDIDVFLYKNLTSKKVFEISHKNFPNLDRELQVFYAHDRKDFEKMSEGLISNIIFGNIIKGNPYFLKVSLDEKFKRNT
jgi:predicted nucleotidyltransferase